MSFKELSRAFSGGVKGISRGFQGTFNWVLKVFERRSKGISRNVFQGHFNEVFNVFQ